MNGSQSENRYMKQTKNGTSTSVGIGRAEKASYKEAVSTKSIKKPIADRGRQAEAMEQVLQGTYAPLVIKNINPQGQPDQQLAGKRHHSRVIHPLPNMHT
jgi:hypothetical protein